MLKLKLQYFGHLMQRTESLEKTLMLGTIEGGGGGYNRGWDGWMASPTQWTWVWVSSGSWWWTGRPGVLQSMGSQRVGHDWVTGLNWTERLLHPFPCGPFLYLPDLWSSVFKSLTDFCLHCHISVAESDLLPLSYKDACDYIDPLG